MKHLLAVSAWVCIVCAGSAMADLSSGSLTGGGGGITATGSWDSPDTEIEWLVTQSVDLTWHYKYTFEVPAKDLGHIIFQVSPDFTLADFLSPGTPDLKTFSPEDPGKSNPGLPGDIYGLKFEGGGLVNTIEFDSTRAPMWGDFYAKGGKDEKGTVDLYAYNTNFGVDENTTLFKIAVPDTDTDSVVVPLPGAVLLSLLGLSAAGLRLRRRV